MSEEFVQIAYLRVDGQVFQIHLHQHEAHSQNTAWTSFSYKSFLQDYFSYLELSAQHSHTSSSEGKMLSICKISIQQIVQVEQTVTSLSAAILDKRSGSPLMILSRSRPNGELKKTYDLQASTMRLLTQQTNEGSNVSCSVR